MDNTKFNEQRYCRKRRKYRLYLGIQQLINYPLLNFLWILFIDGAVFIASEGKKYIGNMIDYPVFGSIVPICMIAMIIIFSVLCVIGLIMFIGGCFALKDEANMEIAFGDKKDVRNQPPILISKKKHRKSGIIQREFYTTIPMERWQEKKEAISDIMNIHIISDITYGGRKKNKGNHIYFESAKGRNPTERGVLYDDTF